MRKITTEKRTLESNFTHWENLMNENAPIQKRLKFARLDDYIKDAKRFIDFSGEK